MIQKNVLHKKVCSSNFTSFGSLKLLAEIVEMSVTFLEKRSWGYFECFPSEVNEVHLKVGVDRCVHALYHQIYSKFMHKRVSISKRSMKIFTIFLSDTYHY